MRNYARGVRADCRQLVAKSRAFRKESDCINKAGARLTDALLPVAPLGQLALPLSGT